MDAIKMKADHLTLYPTGWIFVGLFALVLVVAGLFVLGRYTVAYITVK